MRIVRWSGLRAVVKVKSRGDVTVAIPRGVPSSEVLDLASLVLSGGEYQELCHVMGSAAPQDGVRAQGPGRGAPGRPA
jgi:hypothetical protein